MTDHWIMDYETLVNCFVGVFTHNKKDETKIFVVHDNRNDLKEFLKFLNKNYKNKERHISFNGLEFDSQVTQYIINNYKRLLKLSGCKAANDIFKYAMSCINNSRQGNFPEYSEWKMNIKQIDLYKLNHWDNPAKKSSLKWIQYSLDLDNILEMPIHHETSVETDEQIDIIVNYCVNDVSSTKEIYNICKPEIQLRHKLSKMYGLNLYSASEARIAKEIFRYYLEKEMNTNIKNLKTYRDRIVISNLILDYIEFSSPQFKNLLKVFKELSLDAYNLKGSFAHEVTYKNVETHFGLGGVHGARKKGVYESNDEFIIISSDVTSFYPNLTIRNKWSPDHFPNEVFCRLYEFFFNERKKIPKSNPLNYVYKIILNTVYGLSNDENSFFYDPELTMKITVNGQLSLMMLYESIMENIPDAVSLMQNTDGIEIMIPRIYYDKYMQICENWEKTTKLNLEHDTYQKLIIADVNNYIGVFEYKEYDIQTWDKIKKETPHYLFKTENNKYYCAKVKIKGRFNFHDLPLHKNKSRAVVKKGIYYYFIHNVMPEEYLKSNEDIFDYCIGSKIKGNWTQKSSFIKDGQHVIEDLQKINRYYISNTGVKIYKKNNDDNRVIQNEAGKWYQTIFNKSEFKKKFSDYNVNYSYYKNAIESEINKILDEHFKQLKLF